MLNCSIYKSAIGLESIQVSVLVYHVNANFEHYRTMLYVHMYFYYHLKDRDVCKTT